MTYAFNIEEEVAVARTLGARRRVLAVHCRHAGQHVR
jgi:hypothetical protein